MSEENEIKDPAAVLAALARAKEDAKKYREQFEALKAEHESVSEQLSSIKSKIKDTVLASAIERAGAQPERVLRYLDTEKIEYKDGELEGFDEAFNALKVDLPELFDAKRRVGGRVETEIKNPPNTAKSVSELQAEHLLRRS